ARFARLSSINRSAFWERNTDVTSRSIKAGAASCSPRRRSRAASPAEPSSPRAGASTLASTTINGGLDRHEACQLLLGRTRNRQRGHPPAPGLRRRSAAGPPRSDDRGDTPATTSPPPLHGGAGLHERLVERLLSEHSAYNHYSAVGATMQGLAP